MDDNFYRFLPAWDPVVRFLHWWNALAMTVMIVTGAVFIACEDLKGPVEQMLTTAHASAGLLLGGGVFARVIWLFMGPDTARWTDMLPISAHHRRVFIDTIRFYLSGFRKEAPLYLAHNSFAGPIYLAFFAIAAIQVVSGSIVLTTPEKLRNGSIQLETHETGFILILLYIAAHLVAVFIHEMAERRGIVSSMIHGGKTFNENEREAILEAHPSARKGAFDERED